MPPLLGLEQYEAAFRENKIDDTVLPSLTAEDLKDLGVGFVGHRRKLLDAIAALRAEASAPTPLSDAALETDEPGKDTAERRQVTVMFADLVGSTALSAHMDPEDLREVISAYQRCVAETVRRFGGFVARYMGDGVLIYFGYPIAHEDDAERAVRSGLALIDAVATLSAPEPLQVRIGAATGMVVPETRAATERAVLLIEQAEAIGEPPEDPLLLSAYSALNDLNIAAFNGDSGAQGCRTRPGACRETGNQALARVWAYRDGPCLGVDGRLRGSRRASRSGDCARISVDCVSRVVFTIVCAVGPWLS
jgi:Adenylate and Guanylate cyclase catalytic domain/SAM domain (Sterile alpha motif)